MVETFNPGMLAAERTLTTDSTLTPAGNLSRSVTELALSSSVFKKVNFEPDTLDTTLASLPGYGDELLEDDGAYTVQPEEPATEDPATKNPPTEIFDEENFEERFPKEPAACKPLEGHEGFRDLLDMTLPSYESTLKAIPPELQENDAFMDNLGTLPNLIYTGQTDQAAIVKFALLKAAGEEGRPALENYFKAIDTIAKENPALVAELTDVKKNCSPEEN
jgi:hypothetical protein